MSEHTAGNNPVAAGTKIKAAWMEYIEDTLENMILGGIGYFTPSVYVKCYIPDSSQTFANGEANTIAFTNVENIGSGWGAGNAFTAPSDGYYFLSFWIQFAGITLSTTEKKLAVYVYKNVDTVVYMASQTYGATTLTGIAEAICSGSTILHLDEGDVLTVVGTQKNSDTDTYVLNYGSVETPQLVISKISSPLTE